MREKLQVEPEKRLPELQRKFLRSFAIMQGPLFGLLATGVYAASQRDDTSPEEEIAFAVLLGSGFIASLLGVENFIKRAIELSGVENEISKRRKTPEEKLASLRKLPTEEDTQAYLQLQAFFDLSRLLPSHDQSGTERSPNRNLQVPIDENSLTNPRVKAAFTLAKEFFDPQTRASDPRSDMRRTRMLNFMGKRIIRYPITSSRGLPLCLPEMQLLFNIIDWEFGSEQAPETLCALAELLFSVLHLFGDVERLKKGTPPSKEKMNQALQRAVRAEKFSGIRSDIPLGIYRESEEQRQIEETRVLVSEKQARDAAKKLVALCFQDKPEVREQALNLASRSEDDLERVNTPSTKTILDILRLSRTNMNDFFQRDPFFQIPKHQPEIKDGVATIVGIDTPEADSKACRIALTKPTLKRIDITVTATGITISIPMDEFYKNRLTKGHFRYLTNLLTERSLDPQLLSGKSLVPRL